jgi:hypothetical protein
VKILLIPLSGRVSKDGIVSNYGGALRAATDLTPNIAFDTSDTSMIGLEGLCLDTIEESLSPGFDKSRTRITLKFPTQLARLVRFRNTFAKKMTARLYPTGENPKVVFVRCLVLDNKLDYTRVILGTSLSPGEMLTMWDKLYKCLMDHTSISEPNVVYASTDLKAAMMALPLTHIIFEEIKDRTLIITKSGYIGLGPSYAEAGDVISAFNGAGIPCVLRKVLPDDAVSVGDSVTGKRDVDKWEIVGNCYLQGFMDNEVASSKWDEKREMLWIV